MGRFVVRRGVAGDSGRKQRGRRGANAWLPTLAVLVFIGLNFWFDRPQTLRGGLTRIVVVALVPFLLGVFLGRREWPRRGRKLARYLIRRRIRKGAKGLFVSDRPDGREGLPIRMIEVMGFSAGAAILMASILPFLGLADPSLVLRVAIPLALVTLWGSFILVPYWLFGRMGLREVDAERWLVQPVGRVYASRLKLSNGALLLVSVGAVINLAFRAGASQERALLDGISTAVSLILSIFITAITAVSFYMASEGAEAREFEEEVIQMGVTDGRGVATEDFLPRLPVSKSQAS